MISWWGLFHRFSNVLGWTISAEQLSYLVISFYIFNFKNLKGPNFYITDQISTYSTWFTSAFIIFLKFSQINKEWPNIMGEAILQKVCIIWSPPLYFNFRNLKSSNSKPIIRFQFVLHDSAGFFSLFKNFL